MTNVQNVCSEYVSPACVGVCLFVYTHVFKYPYYYSSEIQARKIVNLKSITNFSFKDAYEVLCKSGINGYKRFK